LNLTPDKERSKDKGAETLLHYQYQHSYICLLSFRLYAEEKDPDSQLLLKGIMCEHHEDALGITKDNRFVGIQIKSQIKEIPLTLLDKEVKHSIERFIQLERKYPNQFVKFVIVSNCPFLDDETGKSIMNLLRQVKSQNGTKIEFRPKDIGKFINNLIDDGCSYEEIIKVINSEQGEIQIENKAKYITKEKVEGIISETIRKSMSHLLHRQYHRLPLKN
jgi:Cap4, dsDNA endonuclease domain